MAVAYLGLGSNLGDRRANLQAALRLLSAAATIKQVSSLYETEPVGLTAQPRFLNAACAIETALSAHALLRFVKGIERRLGRQPGRRFGPRSIDVDILLYGAYRVRTRQLTIPHPRLAERVFALVPLRELAPEVSHPTLGVTVNNLAGRVGGEAGVERVEGPAWAGIIPDP